MLISSSRFPCSVAIVNNLSENTHFGIINYNFSCKIVINSLFFLIYDGNFLKNIQVRKNWLKHSKIYVHNENIKVNVYDLRTN